MNTIYGFISQVFSLFFALFVSCLPGIALAYFFVNMTDKFSDSKYMLNGIKVIVWIIHIGILLIGVGCLRTIIEYRKNPTAYATSGTALSFLGIIVLTSIAFVVAYQIFKNKFL